MRINLSIQGIASRILVFNPDSTLYKATCRLDIHALQKTLFENDEFLKLSLNPKVPDYSLLPTSSEYLIVDNGRFNRVEFKREGRRVQKLFVRDLKNDLTLMPIFSIQHKSRQVEGLVIVEQELGCIGQFEVECQAQFDILDMEFTQTEFQQLNIQGLSQVSYRGRRIKWRNKRTLVQNRVGLILN